MTLRQKLANWLINAGAFKDLELYFVRNRSGLGARIRRLLRVYVLADLIGAKFKFEWSVKNSDGIFSAEQTFDSNFLLRHRTDGEFPRYAIEIKGVLSLPTIMSLMRYRQHSVAVNMKSIYSDKKKISNTFNRNCMSFEAAFKQIQFAPAIQTLRTYVSEKYKDFDIAIHVRRGDIKHGLSRIGGRFSSKAIPLPIILAIIEKLPHKSRVLLVDNENVCNEFSGLEKYVVINTATEKIPVLETAMLRAFFDLFMLMNCRSIVAGSSNFAILAAEVSSAECRSWQEYIDNESAMRKIIAFVSSGHEVDSLEVVLACQFALTKLGNILSREEKADLISIAGRADPKDPSFALADLAANLRECRLESAEENIKRAVYSGALEVILECAKYWKIGHADIKFDNLVRPGGVLEEGDWQIIETNSGKLPFLDWFLAAADLVRNPEYADKRLQLAKELTRKVNENWFRNDHYEELFYKSRFAVASTLTPM